MYQSPEAKQVFEEMEQHFLEATRQQQLGAEAYNRYVALMRETWDGSRAGEGEG